MGDVSLQVMQKALGEWGQHEVKGTAANPRVGAYLEAVGLPPSDETSWCSAFLYWCASAAGAERPDRTKAPAARSWLGVGHQVLIPETGDVVVLSRGTTAGWQAHVGIFVAKSSDGHSVYVLGGNQGDAVGISAYPAARVLGYRRLSEAKA